MVLLTVEQRKEEIENFRNIPNIFSILLCTACHHVCYYVLHLVLQITIFCTVHEGLCIPPCFSESSVSSSSPGSGPSSPNNGPTGNVTENEGPVLPPTPHPEVRPSSSTFGNWFCDVESYLRPGLFAFRHCSSINRAQIFSVMNKD